MSLIINNVTKGSLKIKFDYLDSDELFGYTVVGDYTIDISDLSFTDNEGVLLANRDAINAAYKRKNITARIGADEYINGRITSVSFSESPLVGSEQASITIEEGKRLDDYSNHTFAEYLPSPHLLESFDENFDFSSDGSDYSYNRNISIKYKQSTESTPDEFSRNLKIFVSHYYHTVRPDYGFQQDGISENAKINKGFNGLISETVDLVNLSYSLSESFSSSYIHEDENVSKKFTQTESVDEAGYLNKTVQVELISLRRDNQNVLRSAVVSTIDDVKSQEESVYGTPLSIERGFSRNSNKANLKISFSTSPKSYRDSTVTYSCQKQKAGSFNEYSLSLEYSAIEKNNRERLKAAKAFRSGDSQSDKVRSLFSEAGSLYEKSRNTSFDYGVGKISESVVFTEDDAYNSGTLPAGILKYKKTLNSTNRVNRFTIINDIEKLKQKLAVSSLKTLRQASVTAEAVALPCFGLYHARDFLNSKTSDLNSLLGEGGYFIISDQTTVDLGNGTANRVINYVIPT